MPPDEPLEEDWKREFERLREAYRSTLADELATLGNELREARASASAGPALEAARRLAHRLMGTAGSYGLDESCAALEQIEDGLDRLLGAAPPGHAQIWADLEESLHRARAGLEPRSDAAARP